jgi:hypothetical protein
LKDQTQGRSDVRRAERDRFVAFSFTAADVLVEINSKGAIT